MKTKNELSPAGLELKRRVDELIAFKGGGYNEEAVADIIENALKLLTDVKDTGDVRVIQTAVRELRYAYRLFAPYANKRKVTIFGSARTAPELGLDGIACGIQARIRSLGHQRAWNHLKAGGLQARGIGSRSG